MRVDVAIAEKLGLNTFRLGMADHLLQSQRCTQGSEDFSCSEKKTEYSNYDKSKLNNMIKSLRSEKDILLLEDDDSESPSYNMKLEKKYKTAINGFTGKGYGNDSICDKFLSWIFMW